MDARTKKRELVRIIQLKRKEKSKPKWRTVRQKVSRINFYYARTFPRKKWLKNGMFLKQNEEI